MEAIREYIKIIDKKIYLSKEVPFDSDEVEVIILPYKKDEPVLKESLVDFIQNSPLADEDINIERNKDTSRDIAL